MADMARRKRTAAGHRHPVVGGQLWFIGHTRDHCALTFLDRADTPNVRGRALMALGPRRPQPPLLHGSRCYISTVGAGSETLKHALTRVGAEGLEPPTTCL